MNPITPKVHIRAGHDRAAVLRSLKAYCIAPRYRAALQAGAARIDLHGRPAGVVTEREAAPGRRLKLAEAYGYRRSDTDIG